MDARELTKVVEDQQNKIIELEKKVDYLEQVAEKQRLLLDDLRMDVYMLERSNK